MNGAWVMVQNEQVTRVSQLKARFMGDPQAETHTRVSGVVGHFTIEPGTKSGIVLASDCAYIAAFEAKLYSPIAKGVKAAPGYDQVSQTTASLLQALLGAGVGADCAAHVIVLYLEDNPHIDPGAYTEVLIGERIRERLAGYQGAGVATAEIKRFEAGWQAALARVGLHFVTWERVLAGIGDGELDRF